MKPIFQSLFLMLSISLVLTSMLTAQTNTVRVTRPIAPAEPQVTQPDEMVGLLVLRDESALQVLDMLEKMTGKIILRRQDIVSAKINFNSQEPISKAEAVLALESLLTLNGIMLTDMGGRFMKAVPATNVNSHVPQMLDGSTLSRPPSQQIYAKLFKLEYLQAEQTNGTTITPLLSQSATSVVFPKSNALLISDALINLQRIEKILQKMDQPQAIREDIQFIKLNYIQANEMQQRIENLVQGPLKNYLEGNTSVASDERTNQLIVITHPGNIDIIQRVIDSVDVDAAPLTATEVIPLRQAKAEEVVAIIEKIISGQKEGREEDAKVTSKNNKQNNKQKNPEQPTAESASVAPTVQATIESSAGNSSLQFSNFVGLSADPRTNAIVAYGTQQDLKTLKDLIEKIDIPLPQVLIEAVITEVTLREDQASGISSFGFQYDGSTNIFDAVTIATAGGTGISGGSVDLKNPDNFSLTALVTASDTDSNARILSTPRIMVSHNEEGVINVSESRPIITSSTSFTNSANGNVRSNVEYRDIGIKLTVTPLIGADGTVQMKIEQAIENVVGTIQVDENDQPIIGIREATSTVSVQDNQVIVLGGLQQNSVTDGNSYVPILRRIPIFGELLGTDSTEYDRTELIIFLRPKVLQNPAIAQSLSDEYIASAEEKQAIQNYLEHNTSDDLYMEGSKFEKKDKDEAPLPSASRRSLRRIR